MLFLNHTVSSYHSGSNTVYRGYYKTPLHKIDKSDMILWLQNQNPSFGKSLSFFINLVCFIIYVSMLYNIELTVNFNFNNVENMR